MKENKYDQKKGETFLKAYSILKDTFAKDNIHISDEQFMDGYFIFELGSNSVVNFHIKKAPEFLFGIWWETDTCEDGQVKGILFAQYEQNIDKFKPSASVFSESVYVKLEEPENKSIPQVAYPKRMIDFIIKEPELAWYRDNFYADFNEEYVSREDAKKAFNQYKNHLETERRIIPELNSALLQGVIKLLDEEFDEYIILYRGDDAYPEYEAFSIANGRGPGHYEMFAKDSKNAVEYATLLTKLNKKAAKEDVYWIRPIDDTITLVAKAKYQKLAESENIYRIKEKDKRR